MFNTRQFWRIILSCTVLMSPGRSSADYTNLNDFLRATKLGPAQLKFLVDIERLPGNLMKPPNVVTFHSLIERELEERHLGIDDGLVLLKTSGERALHTAPIFESARDAGFKLPEISSLAELGRANVRL